jgi:hypothetical protein
VRKVSIRKPSSELQHSFAQIAKMGSERPSNRTWKRRDEDRGGVQDHLGDDRDPRTKHQQGMAVSD